MNSQKEAIGQGTTDGTFGGHRYFDCPQDCGVFVAVDKIRPYTESVCRSSKNEGQSNFKSETEGKTFPEYRYKLKIDQRVVVFVDDQPVSGYVRWIADTLDTDGSLPVGIELVNCLSQEIIR